jgi:hypothetical protein
MSDSTRGEKMKAHIVVGTPMFGGMCSGFYSQSVSSLQRFLNEQGIAFNSINIYNESLIQRARNAMVKNAFKTDFTHFMFIDSDIRFHGNDVISLIQADKPVIAGIYPKKEINWKRSQMPPRKA